MNISKKKEKKIIVFIFIFIIIFFYIFKSSLYFDTDEIININVYTYPELFLLKNYPNNHIFTSIFGLIIKNIISTDLIYLRLISLLSFLGIIFILLKIFKNNITISLFIILYSSSSYLFTYTMFFRGYYFSSFLFVLIFYFLKGIFDKKKNNFYLKIIYFISSLLGYGILSNFYLIIPIFITLMLLKNKKNMKYLLIYFGLPFFTMQFISVILSGIYNNKELFLYQNFNFVYLVLNNFLVIIVSGFKTIFLNEYLKEKLTFQTFADYFNQDKSLLIIFILAFALAIYKFIKKKLDNFDFIIIIFPIIFILVNKSPPLRTYVGYIYFFIFYILINFEKNFQIKFLKLFQKYNFFLICMISLCLILFNQKNFYPKKELINDWEKNFYTNLQIKKDLDECILTNEKLTEFQKQFFFYNFTKKCGTINNYNIFRNFYKS